MADPFQRPKARLSPQRLRDFFSPDPEVTHRADQEEAKARAVIEWVERPYHREFIRWLDRLIDQPQAIGDHATMISGASRTNTLKEIKKHLLDLEHKARAFLEE